MDQFDILIDDILTQCRCDRSSATRIAVRQMVERWHMRTTGELRELIEALQDQLVAASKRRTVLGR